MNWSHSRIRLSMASMLTLLLPVLSAVGAAVFLAEPITVLQISGMLVVLAALTLAIRRNAQLRARQT